MQIERPPIAGGLSICIQVRKKWRIQFRKGDKIGIRSVILMLNNVKIGRGS